MVLLDNIIQIFHLTDDDGGAMLLVVALDRRGIGLTAVDGDGLGDPMAADRLLEKAQGGLLIPLIREQKVNGSMAWPCLSTAR